jgi:hypothetical protein
MITAKLPSKMDRYTLAHTDSPPEPSSTSEIPAQVAAFRTAFFWPLTLVKPDESQSTKELLDKEIEKLMALGNWEEVSNLAEHTLYGEASAQSRREDYAERIYFHDFVQEFLFPDIRTRADHMRLLRRSDVKRMQINLHDRGCFNVQVDKLAVYIAPVGVAILVLELSCDKPGLQLADVQDFNNRMRRLHTPYFEDDGSLPAHQTVKWIKWLGADNGEIGVYEAQDQQNTAIPVRPFKHWLDLLGFSENKMPRRSNWPMSNTTQPNCLLYDGRHSAPSWRHFADDRMPILSTICITDENTYRNISDGDWMRTCFVDGSGPSPFPYSSDFLHKTWDKHVYDRHNYGAEDNDSMPSRFLICGYALIAVGVGDFFRKNTALHMRRHYFQMMLIIQLERATMLDFSSRITHAVTQFSGDLHARSTDHVAQITLQKQMQQIERDFLSYTHRFKFTGISSQQQAVEMYDQMRSVTALDQLYEDIKNELTTATQFLFSVQSERNSEAAQTLNSIAGIGVALTLGLGIAALSDQAGNSLISTLRVFKDYHLPAAVMACVALMSGLVCGLVWSFDSFSSGQALPTRNAKTMGIIAVILAALSFVSDKFDWPAISAQAPPSHEPAQTGNSDKVKNTQPKEEK